MKTICSVHACLAAMVGCMVTVNAATFLPNKTSTPYANKTASTVVWDNPAATEWGTTPMNIRQALARIHRVSRGRGPALFSIVWLQEMMKAPKDYGLTESDQSWIQNIIVEAAVQKTDQWQPVMAATAAPATVAPLPVATVPAVVPALPLNAPINKAPAVVTPSLLPQTATVSAATVRPAPVINAPAVKTTSALPPTVNLPSVSTAREEPSSNDTPLDKNSTIGAMALAAFLTGGAVSWWLKRSQTSNRNVA